MTRRGVLVLFIGLATVGFVIGVAMERARTEEPRRGEATATEGAEGEAGNGEGEEEAVAEEGGEEILGLNPDSTPLVASAVGGSLLLAGALWVRPRRRPLLVVGALVMLAFAVFDMLEVARQLDESAGAAAIVAAIVAGLHLAAAATAGVGLRGST